MTEGCLSLPGFELEVDRAAEVVVTGLNREGERIAIEASDLLAIALQHEMDHLDGRLLVDYASSLKRSLYRKKRVKEQAAEAEEKGKPEKAAVG